MLLHQRVSTSNFIELHISHRHINLATITHVLLITDAITLHWPGINSFFKFSICLFLYSLRILQFLNKLHFQHFHLHYFSLFLFDDIFFFYDSTLYFFSGCFVLLSPVFFYFGSLNSFLLFLQFIFKVIFLCLLIHVLVMSLFILFTNELGLLCLFLLVHQYSFGNLCFFMIPLLFHICYFLFRHGVPHLLSLHLVHFLLCPLIVFLFEFNYFVCSPFCLFDLLPGFHFFLFQQSNSVCK